MEQYMVTGQDLFNSIAQGYNSNAIMQYVIRLKEKIDFELLKKAVEISLLQEPVLGCRLNNTSGKLTWEPVDGKDSCCYQVEEGESKNAVNEFLSKELSPQDGVQILVCLICGKSSDTICVKIGHAACDGCGSKHYIRILSEIYTQLSLNINFRPKISTQERSTDRLYSALGIKNKQEFFQPELAELKSTWGISADSTERSQFQYELMSFTKAEFEALHQYAKQHHATINSVVLAAYYSSLLKTIQIPNNEAEKEIQTMIDLRKYLAYGIHQDICNLSSAVNINLPVQYKDDMEKLIFFATNEMEKVKNEKAFIHGALGADLAAGSGYAVIKNSYISEWEHIKATGNCTPMLSNLGVLSTTPISFADVQVNEVDYVSPAFYAPAVMLGICTYCSRLTLCISYYTPEISTYRIKELLACTCESLHLLTNKT